MVPPPAKGSSFRSPGAAAHGAPFLCWMLPAKGHPMDAEALHALKHR